MKLLAYYRRSSTALVVLVLGLLLTALATWLVMRQLEREERLRFESTAADARAAVATRVNDYAGVLRGLAGLFAANDAVSRDAFRRYISNLDLPRRYPGIQVIHYSQRVSAADRAAFEARIRRDTSVDPRGYPGFSIRPPGDRPEYVVAQYVEPMAGNERALGLDLAGDAVRLAALAHTRDSGRITASGTIALALDPKRHPGFAMRLAIYRHGAAVATVERRREAFTGVVSASFVVIDLMRDMLSEAALRSMRVRIHDAGFLEGADGPMAPAADNLMFDSDRLRDANWVPRGPWGAEPEGLGSVSELEVGGRRWHLYFSARESFAAASDRWLPWFVLLGGTVISLLLFGLTRSLANTGRKAVALANSITQDLRKSEASLAEAQRMTQQLIETLPNPIFFKGTDGRYLGVNKAWEAYFGTSREAFLGKTVHDLYPGDPATANRLHAMDQALWEHPGTQVHETSITTRDGRRHEAIYYKATFTRADGSVAGLIGTIVDITERTQAERALRDSESRYRSVIAAIAEGVLLRDAERRIVTCNASAERILGRSLEQMKGSVYFDPSWQAIREDGSAFPEADRPLNAAMRTGRLQSNVVMGFRKPDDSVLWLSMSARPLFDEPGAAPSAVVTTITDITQRKQAELRQEMEHRVTRLLSESEALEDVAPRLIQTICETLGWACGAYWRWDGLAEVLRCADTWHGAGKDAAAFMDATAANVNEAPAWQGGPPGHAGGGLIRRVWGTGAPVWLADVARVEGFRRGPDAAKAGLHCAFGFPVMAGLQPMGVMEFYGHSIQQPDEALLQVVKAIGRQIGQFVVRKQAEERVRHLAHYDALTGLPNRSMFHQRVGQALARARRGSTRLAILFIDLDRFKNINDTLGHDVGDAVLTQIAGRLRGSLREVDTIGRLGGDEFVVLIEDLPEPAQVTAVAQKILAEVAKPITLDEHEMQITASIGISTYPDDSGDLQGLMKNADIAMYRAKEQGKNNYQFYSALMNVHTLERLAMETDLRRALERGEFLLHYQPKVEIRSGRICGVEALVRWQQPAKGLIPPSDFIPLAEETGLIVQIGEWVLRTACARCKAWQELGLPPMRIAVNLSAGQFAREGLLREVAGVLADTGLDPALLELEITESMVMRNPEHAVALLDRLKAMGISISIDDFGTGYSSLSYLKRFPIDSVKIDRSFIEGLPADGDDAAITQAIVAMAHSLGLSVIAEGVETDAQRQFLREHACDELQGYLFSKPLPENAFVHLARESGASLRQAARWETKT